MARAAPLQICAALPASRQGLGADSAQEDALIGRARARELFPRAGNHESNDGDHYQRYENIAGGLGEDSRSTATSALGEHLTKGTLYAMGLHGATPSNTSRYASSTIGLIHMIGLDLNNLDDAQLAWLETDLAAADANRANVPWIMVASHFPIYHSAAVEHRNASYLSYVGDEEASTLHEEGRRFVDEGAAYAAVSEECASEEECRTIGEFQAILGAALQPLFAKYKIDLYNAGHVHSYEATWPLCDFTTGELCDGKQDFIDPAGPVHITEGNGGVPGVAAAHTTTDCTKPGGFCRVEGTGGAYARITAWNATHFQYDHVQNADGAVTDTFTIVRSKPRA